jgi:predicted phosphate transport protein (TIGR00153 family)
MSVVSNIFGSSPVQPLEEHVGIVSECAQNLKPLFVAAISGDWAAVETVHADVEQLEARADEVKKQIRLHMPRSLFMPVPRQDLLELLMVQDKIANLTRDISGTVLIRRLEIPPIVDEFLAFVDLVVESAKLARQSVRELDELFASGFRGAEAELVEGLIERLDGIESETDRQQVAISRKLFEIESTLDPVQVIFLYRVIEQTGDVADMAESVGRRLELLLAH